MSRARRKTELGPGDGAQLAWFLRDAESDILRRWKRAARALDAAQDLAPPRDFEHLSSVLHDLAEVADEIEAGRPADVRSDAAARHALGRLDQGFDLAMVVRELSLLRDSVVELWDRIHPADIGPLHLLDRVMSDAITASIDEYVSGREHTLRALDAVSSTALEVTSIDEVFERLLEAFLSSTPAVDAGAILLVEHDRLTVRAAAGLEPGVTEHFAVAPVGPGRRAEGFAAMVARVGEPLHVSEAELQRSVLSETLRARAVRALFGVPLLDKGRVVCVAYMGSHTAPAFGRFDRRMFESMSVRATSTLAQHVARDLAQHRAAELAFSEQRFRATFAHAPVGIAHVALDGTWLRVNQRYCQLLGYDEEELLRSRYQDLMHPGELIRDGVAARAMLEGRMETYAVEKCHVRPDGHTIWVRLTASLAREDSNRAPYFIGILEDITEYKAVESALRAGEEHARQALRRERAAHEAADRALAELDSLLAAASAGITIIDTELRFVRVNEALAHQSGLPVEAHLGRTVREVLASSWDVDKIERLLGRVLESGEVSEIEVTTGLDRSDPARRSLLVSLFPVRAQEGEILGVGGIVMDITERKAMEDALRANEQRAQRSVRLRDQVLAIVSHDLRNPLGAIRMAASLLLQRGTLEGDERKYIEVIDRAGGRMERLIADLVDLAAVESGRLALELEPHDLRRIVNDSYELHLVIARSKGIELRCSPSVPEVTVSCDRERILQVLGNLIGNALKFCTAEDTVEIDVQRRATDVVILVSDTGPGVPYEKLEQLFEAYWTTAVTSTQGTGLGLFIVKGIVEAHGGTIGARNRTPRGATFWFSLPIAVE